MKRRWTLVLVGVTILAVASVLAVVLLVPRAPFQFLVGQDPLPADQGLPRDYFDPERDLIYSFKAVSEELISRVRAELTHLGFREAHGVGPAMYFIGKEVEVILWESRRMERVSMRWLERQEGIDPGWMTVLVIRRQRPGTWDRIKEAFGL